MPLDQANHKWVTRSPMAHDSAIKGLEDLPLSMTVAEVAAVLRVGRTTVYELIHRWNATDGREGLPACRLGRCIRVPGAAVVRLLSAGSDGHVPAA
jgi:excisionase family DNA binding protein